MWIMDLYSYPEQESTQFFFFNVVRWDLDMIAPIADGTLRASAESRRVESLNRRGYYRTGTTTMVSPVLPRWPSAPVEPVEPVAPV